MFVATLHELRECNSVVFFNT